MEVKKESRRSITDQIVR